MNQECPSAKVKRRPGGRTAEVTARVHEAIIDLLVEGGVEACTFSAVAQRAGIERSTLYRRFSDRWDAIIDAFMARAAAEVMPELGNSFPDDLRSVLRRLAELLESPIGPVLLKVAAELQQRADAESSRDYFHTRMAQLSPMFEAAIARGELAREINREELFTLAAGPIYHRKFIAGRALDEEFIGSVVRSICKSYCPADIQAKLSLPARIA